MWNGIRHPKRPQEPPLPPSLRERQLADFRRRERGLLRTTRDRECGGRLTPGYADGFAVALTRGYMLLPLRGSVFGAAVVGSSERVRNNFTISKWSFNGEPKASEFRSRVGVRNAVAFG